MTQLSLVEHKSLTLSTIFAQLHNLLYTNSNIPRAERLGAEMVRILFCKIYDEQVNAANPQFRIHAGESPEVTARRVHQLFAQVKQNYPDVFTPHESIHLDNQSLIAIVQTLQDFNLLGAERDAISEALQAFWGPKLRGEKGQFFTPRNVVQLCVQMLMPRYKERIIDPACGSGGFLVEVLFHANDVAIYGIDKEIDMTKISKAYLALVGGDHRRIFCADSLAPHTWDGKMRQEIADESFDIVLTNPPFGARIPIHDKHILRHYALGYEWKRKGQGKWVKTMGLNPRPPQILFIERCLQLLKQGGRMAIVLPDGVLSNPSDRYVWEYVLQQARVTAVVSLCPETFLPSTHTKTSIVFLEKIPDNSEENYPIFMAIAERVGHDKNGKTLFKMDKRGRFVLDEWGNKIVDDDLPAIGEKFNDFRMGLHTSEYDRLGFVVMRSQLKDHIFVPSYYNPETIGKLESLKCTNKYWLVSIGELVKQGVLSIRRGHEVGSIYYGKGDVPFVRTTDIVNWEIKIDPIKGIPEEVYERYKRRQDIRPNDILLVTDGTFLIGRTAIVTPADGKMVIQSHIRRIRCEKPDILHPYLLLYLLNTDVVQRQIKDKTFVQATISTVGERLKEIVLPVPTSVHERQKIINEVEIILQLKIQAKQAMERLMTLPLLEARD